VAALGAVRAFDPFAGDQALFLVGAQELHAGAVLYRDFWDLKQPGIFLFYLAGGSAAGFTQSGIHIFEIAWQCAFGGTLFAALRGAVRRPAVAALAVLAVPAAYYAGTTSWHLTQVEALTGLPLLCCAWAGIAAWTRANGRARSAFAAGLAAGCVLLLKLLYLPIAFVLFAVAASAATGTQRHERAPIVVTAWLGGLAVPLALTAAYATAFGLWNTLSATFVSLPAAVVAGGHAPSTRLWLAALWFARRFAPVLFLGAIGLLTTPSAGGLVWRRIAVAWFVTGGLALIVQTQSWWEYQFLLLLPPAGILATLGADASLARLRGPAGAARTAAGAALAAALLLCFGLGHSTLAATARVLRDRPFTSAAALERHREIDSGEYTAAAHAAASLSRGGNDRQAIYVCGDPLIYLLAKREQAVAINGWALELYPPDWWAKLDAQLQRTLPADVFVAGDDTALIAARSPLLARMLDTEYERAVRLPDGTWYRLRTLRRSP
jgi:hypothetical protein